MATVRRLYVHTIARYLNGRSLFDKAEAAVFSRYSSASIKWNSAKQTENDFPKIYFVHIPKTGGMSFRSLLDEDRRLIVLRRPWEISMVRAAQTRVDEWNLTTNHMSTDSLVSLRVFTPAEMNDLLSVAIVRNPIDRFFSLFRYHKQLGTVEPELGAEAYLEKVIAFAENRPRVGLHSFHGLSQALPQSAWLTSTTWNGPRVILRLEELQSDIHRAGLPIPIVDPPQLNVSDAAYASRSHLSKQLKMSLERFYGSDFERLSY